MEDFSLEEFLMNGNLFSNYIKNIGKIKFSNFCSALHLDPNRAAICPVFHIA